VWNSSAFSADRDHPPGEQVAQSFLAKVFVLAAPKVKSKICCKF